MTFDRLNLDALYELASDAYIADLVAELPAPEPEPAPGEWRDSAFGCAPEDELEFDRFRNATLGAWDGIDRGVDAEWQSQHRDHHAPPPMARRRRRRRKRKAAV